MKSSPIQLLQLFFKRVRVDYDEQHAPAEPLNPYTTVFTFDGVTLRTQVGMAEVDPDHENGRVFLVSVRLEVPNTPNEGASSQKFSPYKLDIEAEALVLVVKGPDKGLQGENLAIVNGAALVWSAIREQVSNLTWRMQAGPITLPTVNFLDLKKADEQSPASEPVAQPAPARKTRKAATAVRESARSGGATDD
jgi:hypothetical protein